jgi:hypothetical protein
MVEMIATMFSMSVLLLALCAMWLTVREYGQSMWLALIGEMPPVPPLPDRVSRLPTSRRRMALLHQDHVARAAA